MGGRGGLPPGRRTPSPAPLGRRVPSPALSRRPPLLPCQSHPTAACSGGTLEQGADAKWGAEKEWRNCWDVDCDYFFCVGWESKPVRRHMVHTGRLSRLVRLGYDGWRVRWPGCIQYIKCTQVYYIERGGYSPCCVENNIQHPGDTSGRRLP
jgi:hypothetical protein